MARSTTRTQRASQSQPSQSQPSQSQSQRAPRRHDEEEEEDVDDEEQGNSDADDEETDVVRAFFLAFLLNYEVNLYVLVGHTKTSTCTRSSRVVQRAAEASLEA